MVLKFVCCVVIDIIDFSKANALNSIGYTNTVPFLTIGKPDIYLLKSFGKLAIVFIRVTNNY
jgi:hypothetical protein